MDIDKDKQTTEISSGVKNSRSNAVQAEHFSQLLKYDKG